MKKLKILWKDKNLLIVDKPAKMLCVSTSKEKEKTLYQDVSAYVKKDHPKNKVFILNRLDRDTSGIVLFARNEELKKEIQKHWNELAKVREYLAIVEGKMESSKGVLRSYLKENQNFLVHETTDTSGQLAITKYEVLKTTKNYSLLKIQIETGRKNQIRVQLSARNHPILGDKKYGSSKNPMKRMGLHASFLEFLYLGQKIQIFSEIPKEMKQMFPEEISKYEKERKVVQK